MRNLDYYDGGRLIRVPLPSPPEPDLDGEVAEDEDHEHEYDDGECACGEQEDHDEYMERLRDIADDARFEAKRDERWR